MDKTTLLERRLKEIKEAFEAFKKNGVSEDILITYLMAKTKMSRKKVRQMLNAQEQFYDELVSKEVAEKL
jgi:DNA-binding protein H-NS